MRRASTLISARWVFLGAGILIAGLLCFPVTALTVRRVGGWLPFRAVPVAPGAEFKVTWIHTVSRRPVSETFLIDGDSRLCLKEMDFDHTGPGLPTSPEDGTVWTFRDGKVVVTGYSRCLDQLRLGVCPFGHRLDVGGSCWDLVAGIGPDRLILVSVERTPLLFIVLAEVT